jgi:ABC-type antimicrobial peptide transport system permease subunit
VDRRTAEIGVRMALGAEQSSVRAMTLRESSVFVISGVVIAAPASLVSAYSPPRLLSDLLFGIKPADPLTFTIAICTMLAVALLSGYFPARRATCIDPMMAVRYE